MKELSIEGVEKNYKLKIGDKIKMSLKLWITDFDDNGLYAVTADNARYYITFRSIKRIEVENETTK